MNSRSRVHPDEVVTAWATPSSTPTGGLPFGAASTRPSSTMKEMYQRPPSLSTVALRICPPSGRVHRKRVQPSLGSLARPQRREIRSTGILLPSGKRKRRRVFPLGAPPHLE